jgi:hypothetical protein
VKRLGTLWGAALGMMLALCMLVTPGAARAQGEQSAEVGKDWNVRIGVYIYQMQSTRDFNGEVGISGMLERTVYHGETFDVNVGIGYNGFDRVYSVPVMANAIFRKANLRIGGGVGYAFNKLPDGHGANGPAVDLILGYTFVHGKNPLSVDLRYIFISGTDNILDGYSLTVGAKL